MPWIEQRHRKHIPYARIQGRKVAGPRFDDRDSADMFVRLVDLIGWADACDYVAQAPAEDTEPAPASLRERAIAAGAIDDPVALAVTDPGMPAEPGRALGWCMLFILVLPSDIKSGQMKGNENTCSRAFQSPGG
jgi:hypothetical protein